MQRIRVIITLSKSIIMLARGCSKVVLCAALLQCFAVPAASAAGATSTQNAPTKNTAAIPWDQVGAKVEADYHGDGLEVAAMGAEARLHCVFQRLDGEVTGEGLWLASTVSNQSGDRFRVIATAVGRQALAARGAVTVSGQSARFTRPGLVEEYSVSMDGVQQDFVVTEKPAGDGPLEVQLAVSGARVEQTTYGAQLVLEPSGRKIAYSRLRATDAKGKELPAQIEVRKPSDFGLSMVVDDAGAVYPVRIDPTFSDANWISISPSIPGTDGDITAAVMDDLGNLYIGGNFGAVGTVLANHVAKWNGSNWSALGSGLSGTVYALAVSGTNLYAGGQFTTAGGIAANHIAQWNGSSWSALGSGMSSTVYALAVSGGTLYAGGPFTTAGGHATKYIAQWDGSTWSGLGSGMNNWVRALAVSGATLYAGGDFTTATNSGNAAVTVNYIAQWNGSSWLALGSGMNNSVEALTVSGGTLYAGGGFTRAGGTNANYIAQWNGSAWSGLGSGMSGGYYGTEVYALVVSGTNLYAGGVFYSAGGTNANFIAQWNGSSWSALGSGMYLADFVDASVYALAVSGTNLYAGGSFYTAGGTGAINVAQWNGSSWSRLVSGMDSYVSALAVSGTNLYVGGYFTTAGGTNANYIAQWNGSSWSALGSGMSGNYYPYGTYVSALAVSGTNLYAAGTFTMAGGAAANYIAQWNGSSWSALGAGMNDAVYTLAVSGGALYAGGKFTYMGDYVTPLNYIARWNGSSWSALGAGMNGNVTALAVSGGTLYAGGFFTNAGGITANYIAKWNGSSWSPLGSGMDYSVGALAVSTNGTLYAGGQFTTAGGDTNASYIAQWNGSSWSAVGSGINGTVESLAVSGGTLYAGGGGFSTPGGCFAQWNGSSWSAMGSGINGPVEALVVSGGTLYAGGNFSTAGGKVAAYVAQAVLGDAPGYNLLTGSPSPGGTMQFSFCGYPATNYALYRAFDLRPPVSWVGQQTNTMPISGVLLFTNNPVPSTNNFWRVRSVQ
jgi:hypothetical protein